MARTDGYTTEEVRKAAQLLCMAGGRFGYPMLYEVFGIAKSPDGVKSRLRKRVTDMVARGELIRLDDGVFRYNTDAKPKRQSPFRERIWRYVRKQKPGWTLTDASMVSGVSLTHVTRYCNWLEQEGYIQVVGKDGLRRTYAATSRAAGSPEMPQPVSEEKSPFEAEYRAASRIINIMLCGNLYQPNTAREIVKACRVLLARFGPQPENEEETHGDNENP